MRIRNTKLQFEEARERDRKRMRKTRKVCSIRPLSFESRKGRYLSLIAFFVALTLTATHAPSGAADLGPTARYIVSIDPSAKGLIESRVAELGGKIGVKFNYALDGFVAELPIAIVPLIRKIPNILFVEDDATVSISNSQNTQAPTPSWGLDRVDQRQKVGLPDSVNSYVYQSAGSGATIYIGDTGIYPHSDFGNRLSTKGYTAVNDGNGTRDCNGHGTHVASTSAGTDYGIAKNALLVPVRVMGCNGSGSWSSVIAGLDWILSPQNLNPKKQAVLNLSLGGSVSSSLNSAIKRITDSGISVVVAAGNENANACNTSPASAPSAITVGATNISDSKADFSNFGSCVDIHAPGVNIKAAWITSASSTNTISGTSMAAPHVAGAVAVFLGLKPNATITEVSQFIDSESTKSVISGLNGSTVNKLLYVSPVDFTQLAPVSIRNVVVPIPARDETPVTSIARNNEYSATVAWNGSPTAFASNTVYTATITITPNSGFTLTGLTANFFRVNGNIVSTPNAANSGVFSHSFPATSGKLSQAITFAQPNSMTMTTTPQALVATSSAGVLYPVSFASTTTSVCTVSSGAVNVVAFGTCSITASQAGDANYQPASSVKKSFNITKNIQTITFAQPAAMSLTSVPQPLVATSSAGSFYPISFSSTTTSICSVIAGEINVLTVGTCSITASQAGDAIYAAASKVAKSLLILQPQGPLVISNSNASNIAKGGRGITLNATGGSGNGAISFVVTGAGCSYTPRTKVLTVAISYQPATEVFCSVIAEKIASGTYLAATSLPKIFIFK